MMRAHRTSPAPRRGHFILVGALLALLAFPSYAPGTSADEPGPPTNEVPAAAKPSSRIKPVGISDIGVESERSKRVLSDVLETISPDGTIQNIILALPDLRYEIESFRMHSEQIQAGIVSVSELDDLANDWEPLSDQLLDQQEHLDTRVRRVDEAIDKIRIQRKRWIATRTSIDEQEVSREIVLQIDEVDTAIDEAMASANTQQAAGVRLQSNVASLGQLIESDLERISRRRQAVVGEVFHRDSPPLWSGEFWALIGSQGIEENFSAIQKEYRNIFAKFLSRQQGKVIFYLGLVFLLVGSMYLIRRRASTVLGLQPESEVLRAIFTRPISLGLLLSFVLALGIFAGSLRTLEYVLSAMTVIPAVLILRMILEPPLYPLLNITLVVYFIENLRAFLIKFPVLARVLFIIELSVLLVFAWSWIRSSRLREIARPGLENTLYRTLEFTLKLVLVASSIALLANIAGYGSLSQLIGKSLAFGIYSAVVLYGSCLVLDSCAAFALTVRPLGQVRLIRNNRLLLSRRIRLLIFVSATALWARAVLVRLELWPGVTSTWEALLATEVPLPQIAVTIGDTLTSVLVFYVAVLISRFVQFFLREDIYPRFSIPTGRSSAISTLLHYVVLILGFVFGAVALGFDANRFTLLAGAFGVGIGFGLQSIVNNFISGIILLTEQPVQVGDTIEMGPIFGEVQRIGIRSSTVRSFQGAEIIVPNADLIAEQVTNWTLSDRRRRVEISLGIAYGSDPDLVLRVLTQVAQNHEDILQDPEPYALFRGFGESSLNFELRAWTDEFDNFLRVKSALSASIVGALRSAGLEIPFPQRDLHVRSIEGAQPASEDPSQAPT